MRLLNEFCRRLNVTVMKCEKKPYTSQVKKGASLGSQIPHNKFLPTVWKGKEVKTSKICNG